MIRLTNQFSPAYSRASAASPKSSGCCSCCCCCVLTILGASVLTARSIQAPPRLDVPVWPAERPELLPSAGATEPTLPAIPTADLQSWKLVSFLLLPLSLAVGIVLDVSVSAFPIFVSLGLATWIGSLIYLVVTKRLKWGIALSVVILTGGFLLLEAYLWLNFAF